MISSPAIDTVPRRDNQPVWELPAPLPPAAEQLHRKQRLAAAFRLFARAGVLSGDGVYTLRTRMRQIDNDLAR